MSRAERSDPPLRAQRGNLYLYVRLVRHFIPRIDMVGLINQAPAFS